MGLTTYVNVSRLSWANYRAYISEFLGNIFYVPFLFGFQFLVFRAIYVDQTEVQGYNFSKLMGYSAIVIILTISYPRGMISYSLEAEIIQGSIITRYCLPVNYIYFYFSTHIPQIIISISTGIGGYLLISYYFKLFPTPSIMQILCFAIWVLLSSYLIYLIFFIIGTTTFYFGKSSFLRDIFGIVERLLGGVYFPLAWLPLWGQMVLIRLPFSLSYGVPGEILVGNKQLNGLVEDIIFLGIWIILLTLFGNWFWRRASNKFEANGG